MAIEVFELAEHEDALSPVDMEPEKLVHKFKEVRRGPGLAEGEGRPAFSAAAPLPQPQLSVCALAPQLQIKHAVTEAEIQQLKRKVRAAGSGGGEAMGGDSLPPSQLYMSTLVHHPQAHGKQAALK